MRAWQEVLAEFPRVKAFRSEAATPYVLSFSHPPLPGEVLLHHLEQEGLYVSTGSACSTSNPEPSHVLRTLGMSDAEALSTIRLSFSVFNPLEELEQVFPAFRRALSRLQRL